MIVFENSQGVFDTIGGMTFAKWRPNFEKAAPIQTITISSFAATIMSTSGNAKNTSAGRYGVSTNVAGSTGGTFPVVRPMFSPGSSAARVPLPFAARKASTVSRSRAAGQPRGRLGRGGQRAEARGDDRPCAREVTRQKRHELDAFVARDGGRGAPASAATRAASSASACGRRKPSRPWPGRPTATRISSGGT